MEILKKIYDLKREQEKERLAKKKKQGKNIFKRIFGGLSKKKK